uniref:1-acyl-sn-glycerol-3-phosphate acyltransferase n=1 Tax=Parascaris univalens TaxID=6257 RepID=A0A915BWI5_PARUN
MRSSFSYKGGFLSILLVMLIFIVPILWMTSAQFRFRVKIALYGVCFIASTTIGALISLPCGRTPKNHFRMFRIFEYSTFWMGTKFELRNMHYTESDKPFIIIANHQSVLDVLSMSHVWPKNCVVLLKSSLRFVPGFNLCTFLSNSIYIDRFNKAEAHKSLAKVADAIIKENRKVWIFPEGTRSSNGSMLPFKKGAFVIALQAKIPIVPLVFSSYKNFYDMSIRQNSKISMSLLLNVGKLWRTLIKGLMRKLFYRFLRISQRKLRMTMLI